MDTLTIGEALLAALFTMFVVFAVLILLWAVIRVFSFAIIKFEHSLREKKEREA
ncbi:MAG: OadG family protein [Clostridiales Family XIII bacterium]|jgi:Na+-transporting methylmalonyl-CoA/oxaloacetate decarboxylase gamma subunit|nr:OadG family protein [Clostridiales Family XIII bacterium]